MCQDTVFFSELDHNMYSSEVILREIKFYAISWRHIPSLVTLDTPGSLHTCLGSLSGSLILIVFGGFLMFSRRRVLRTPSHPQDECPT